MWRWRHVIVFLERPLCLNSCPSVLWWILVYHVVYVAFEYISKMLTSLPNTKIIDLHSACQKWKPNVQKLKYSMKPLLLQQQQLKSYTKTTDKLFLNEQIIETLRNSWFKLSKIDQPQLIPISIRDIARCWNSFNYRDICSKKGILWIDFVQCGYRTTQGIRERKKESKRCHWWYKSHHHRSCDKPWSITERGRCPA